MPGAHFAQQRIEAARQPRRDAAVVRAPAIISICRLPVRAGRKTSAPSASAEAGSPAAPSTVASAAGPHWYAVCSKNGVSVSSIAAARSAGVDSRSARVCTAHAASSPASSSALASRSARAARPRTGSLSGSTV